MFRKPCFVIGCLFVVLFSSTSFGQIKVGVYGGLTLANFVHSGEYDPIKFETKPQGFFGAEFDYQLNEQSDLYIKLRYAFKGTDFRCGDLTDNYYQSYVHDNNGKLMLEYIEIPFGFRRYFPLAGFDAFVAGGFAVALNTSYALQDEVATYDEIENVNDYDFLIHFGAGTRIIIARRTAILFEILYSRSLTNINDGMQVIGDSWRNIPGTTLDELYTSDIMLSLGVLWEI